MQGILKKNSIKLKNGLASRVEPKNNFFGQRLDKFLKLAQISRTDYATTLEVSHGSITGYIQSKSQLSFANLTKTHELGCNLTWLITGEGEMFSDTEAGNKLRAAHLALNPAKADELQDKYAQLSVFSSDMLLSGFVREFVAALANVQNGNNDEKPIQPKRLPLQADVTDNERAERKKSISNVSAVFDASDILDTPIFRATDEELNSMESLLKKLRRLK